MTLMVPLPSPSLPVAPVPAAVFPLGVENAAAKLRKNDVEKLELMVFMLMQSMYFHISPNEFIGIPI
jgi:hypothetical protein